MIQYGGNIDSLITVCLFEYCPLIYMSDVVFSTTIYYRLHYTVFYNF